MRGLNIPSEIFAKYAAAYDVLNADKDYESECTFIEKIFQSYGRGKIRYILDLGCGTGSHAIRLADRGYDVHGVDNSEKMLAVAQEKVRDKMLQEKIRFDLGNIQDTNLMKTFDAIICMFAVLSYQTSDSVLVSTLSTVKRHLKPGGLFIADFWYGPAVIKQRPEVRVKEVQGEGDRIIRNAKPEMSAGENIIHVNYGIKTVIGNQVLEGFKEKHSMRFFFRPEIESFLDESGLNLERFCCFGDMEKAADEETWNVMIIARRI